MRKHKYLYKLQPFLNRPFFTAKEAKKAGIPSYELSYFCKICIIERITRGIYKSVEYDLKVDFQLEELVLIASSISKGVICLISALCLYDLTDQMMHEYWIAVPNSSKPPKRPHTRIIRMRNMTLGKEKIKLGKYILNIFNRERTIVDSFRFLSKEIAIKALQSYLSLKGKNKPDLIKLQKYAKLLRVNINDYLLSLTT